MKTKIIIEVETPSAEQTRTVPEDGQCEEDFESSEAKKKELKEFREEYAKDLHDYVVGEIKGFVGKDDDRLIERLAESDHAIEDWELDDYGIKITTQEEKGKAITKGLGTLH